MQLRRELPGAPFLCLQPGQHVLDARRVRAPERLGPIEHPGGEAEPARDREAVAPARPALHEPVGRLHALRVELQRGVDDAAALGVEPLQVAEVRRDERRRPAPDELLDHGSRERGPLGRIGARAHLVDEDEGIRVRGLDQVGEVGEVGRERREAPRDRLLVPDVGEEAGEDGEAGALAHRRDDAALGERGDEPDGLEEDALAAGVRPGDDETALALGEHEVEGHDAVAGLDEQGVAALPDHEPGPAARVDLRSRRSPRDGRARARQERVEVREGRQGALEIVAAGRDGRRQLPEDPPDLPGLLALEVPEAVHELDRGRRLDEERRAGLRLVVDDAAHLPLPLPPERDDVASLPDRDRRVGDDVALGKGGEVRLQLAHDLGVSAPQPVANPLELARRGAEHGALLVDRARDLLLEFTLGEQAISDRAELRRPALSPGELRAKKP